MDYTKEKVYRRIQTQDVLVVPKANIVRAHEELYYLRKHWRETAQPGDLIYLDSAGTTYPHPDYDITREADNSKWRDQYVFEYVVSGKGYIECAGQRFTVTAGDFYFLNRFHAHHYYADPDDPFCKLWVNISGPLINSLIHLYGISAGVVIRHCNVERLFRELHDLIATMIDESRVTTEHAIILRLHELIQTLARIEALPLDSDLPLALRIKHYIDEHPAHDLTPDDIAEQFMFNKVYVARVFRKAYGVSPKQYLDARRIDSAKNLLSNSAIPIKEIADNLCFSSSQHFSTTFHQATGLTPSEFRARG